MNSFKPDHQTQKKSLGFLMIRINKQTADKPLKSTRKPQTVAVKETVLNFR